MDISDAFMAANWTEVQQTEQEASDLEAWLVEIMSGDEVPMVEGMYTDTVVHSLAQTAFMAGRAYQADLPVDNNMLLSMPPHLVVAFMEFLAEQAGM